MAQQVRRAYAGPELQGHPTLADAEALEARCRRRLFRWDWGAPQPPDQPRTFAILGLACAGQAMADPPRVYDHHTVEAVSIALTGLYPGEGEPVAEVFDAVRAHPWPRTVPSPTHLASAKAPFQVAWDVIADARDQSFTLGQLADTEDRAQQLGLDTTSPLQRAIAECATAPRTFERVRGVLEGGEY
ncbi:MAG: hypothetical protein AAF211_07585 [Myxococcota bacterium]